MPNAQTCLRDSYIETTEGGQVEANQGGEKGEGRDGVRTEAWISKTGSHCGSQPKG